MFRGFSLCAILAVAVFLCCGAVGAWAVNCDDRPLAPAGSLCDGRPDCLVDFAGYKWWINHVYDLDRDQNGKPAGYWFKEQQWDPRSVYVDSNGLHLQMKMTAIPGAPRPQWSSTEVVLYGDATGKPIIQGYGTYLVAASTIESFDALGRANCTFGAFTYQFKEDGSEINKHHELDMIETGCLDVKCNTTNAEFTLQPWDAMSGNIHRINIAKGTKDITVVMNWPGPDKAVTFSVYYGIYDLDTLPVRPDTICWPIPPEQWKFSPNSDCQPIHLNLWRGRPSMFPPGPQEVVIKKFQYRPNTAFMPCTKAE